MHRKLLLITVLGAVAASAATINGNPVPLAQQTSSRSTPTGNGLISVGGWAGDSLSIAWDIDFDGISTWHYVYTFTGFAQPAMSHWELQLSTNCFDGQGNPDSNCVQDPKLNGSSFTDVEYDDDGFNDSGIVGIKFDDLPEGGLVFAFDSNRAPVWGDFFAKGGRDGQVYNNGFINPTSDKEIDYIARPDSTTTITHTPEPTTWALFGIGGGLLALARLRKK